MFAISNLAELFLAARAATAIPLRRAGPPQASEVVIGLTLRSPKANASALADYRSMLIFTFRSNTFATRSRVESRMLYA